MGRDPFPAFVSLVAVATLYSCTQCQAQPSVYSATNLKQSNASALKWGPTAGPLTRTLVPRMQLEVVDQLFRPGAEGPMIQSNFNNGNIDVEENYGNGTFDLLIMPDPYARVPQQTFLGRFLFRVTNASGVPLELRIRNAGDVNVGRDVANRLKAFEGWKARYSTDYENWVLADTEFDGTTMTIRHTPKDDAAWFAYFPPYPAYRMEDKLLALSEFQEEVDVFFFGRSVLGQKLIMIRIGNDCNDKFKMWVLAGQAAADSQGPWFVEGLVESAAGVWGLDMHFEDPLLQRFYNTTCLYVVPALNVDGMLLGNHRVNAQGMELTRSWNDSSIELTPEVLHLQELVLQHGVDFWMEIKGDELRNEYYLYFADGACNDNGWVWNEEYDKYRVCSSIKEYKAHVAITRSPQNHLVKALMKYEPEYLGVWESDLYGRPSEPFPPSLTNVTGPCNTDPTFSNSWVAEHFGVISTTVMIPFKDIAGFENNRTGMTPQRAEELGRGFFEAIKSIAPKSTDVVPFW